MAEENEGAGVADVAAPSTFAASYDSIESIPDTTISLREAYAKRADGTYGLNTEKFEGVKTQADVDAMRGAKEKAHAKFQERSAELEPFRKLGMTAEEIQARLDFASEAELRLDDTVDIKEKVATLAAEQAKKIANAEIAKYKQPLEQATAELEQLRATNGTLLKREDERLIRDGIDGAVIDGDTRLVKSDMMRFLYLDLADQLTIDRDSEKPVLMTSDGLPLQTLIRDHIMKNPQFQPQAQGMGAKGSVTRSGTIVEANPWLPKTRSLPKQAMLNKEDPELAAKFKKEAGLA